MGIPWSKVTYTLYCSILCNPLLEKLHQFCFPLTLHVFSHPWQNYQSWASLVAQWLRIHLPMQGTQVRALVRGDPTCHGATKPMRHNYWACALEPASHNYWAHVPQLLKPTRLEPVLHNKRSHHNEKPATATKSSPCSPQLEKASAQQQRPNTAKNKWNEFLKNILIIIMSKNY